MTDGKWSDVNLVCPPDALSNWLINPNHIVVIVSVTVIFIIFMVIVSVIFTRRRRVDPLQRKKLTRLRHNFDSNTKVREEYLIFVRV